MIYKYCPANQFTLRNLAGHKLYCRHPEEVYNIFECFDPGDDELESEWYWDDDEVPEFDSPPPGPNYPHEIEQYVTWQAELFDWRETDEEDPTDMRAVYDRARVTSFSTDPRSLLMWAQYAGGLKGCCLVYDRQSIITDPAIGCIADVSYTNSPSRRYQAMLFSDEEDRLLSTVKQECRAKKVEALRQKLKTTMCAVLASKPPEWRYERECRLIVHSQNPDRAPIYYTHPAEALKGIITGGQMDDRYFTRLRQVVEKLGVPLHKHLAVRDCESHEIKFRRLGW